MNERKLEKSISELHEKVDGILIAQTKIVEQLKVSNGRLGKHDEEIKNIWEKIENFPLVKATVFGMIGLIVTAFVGALIIGVFK